MDSTAVTHWPKLLAPVCAALNCRVRRPRPARFSAAPMVVLQLRQAHAKFARLVFSSRPSRWCTSTLRAAPQKAQMRGPGGRHCGAVAR